MTAQLAAPTVAAAVAYELAADRYQLTVEERYAVAEVAAARAGGELIRTGDVAYAVNAVLDARREEA